MPGCTVLTVLTDLSGQTLEFGVDTTDPTIELDSGPADEGGTTMRLQFLLEATDGTRIHR